MARQDTTGHRRAAPRRCARSLSGPLPRLLTELAARSSTRPAIVVRSTCKSNGADITRSGQSRCRSATAHGLTAGGPLGAVGPVATVDTGAPPVLWATRAAGAASAPAARQAAAANASLPRARRPALFQPGLSTPSSMPVARGLERLRANRSGHTRLTGGSPTGELCDCRGCRSRRAANALHEMDRMASLELDRDERLFWRQGVRVGFGLRACAGQG